MRAFAVRELEHPSKISLSKDFPVPRAGPNQVLVDVFSTSLNFFDILQAQGKYQDKPPLPFVLGTEFAGRISKDSPLPEGCKLKRGQRVFGAQLGSLADKMAVDHNYVLSLPDNVSFDQGSGLYVTWPTSYEGLVGRAKLQKGEWVLVTAAAGGVGIAAVQIAKTLGANVIGAVGSSEKIAVVKKYGGADHAIDYSAPGWQKEVLTITNGRGVDVVYDPVGLVNESLKCIAWKGRVVVVGFAGGMIQKVAMNLVLLKNISLVGIFWGSYATKEPQRVQVVWKELLFLIASGMVKPVVYSNIFPLERVVEGVQALESRMSWGKVVVRVRDEKESAKL